MTNGRLLSFVASGVLGVACVLFILSNALPNWGMVKINADGFFNVSIQWELAQIGDLSELHSISVTFGLWRWCLASVCFANWQCIPDKELPKSLCQKMIAARAIVTIAARAIVTIACVISGFGVMALIVSGIMKASNRAIVITSKGLAFLTPVAGIIGISLGISFARHSGVSVLHTPSDSIKLGSTAILAIIATGLSLFSAAVARFIDRQPA